MMVVYDCNMDCKHAPARRSWERPPLARGCPAPSCSPRPPLRRHAVEQGTLSVEPPAQTPQTPRNLARARPRPPHPNGLGGPHQPPPHGRPRPTSCTAAASPPHLPGPPYSDRPAATEGRTHRRTYQPLAAANDGPQLCAATSCRRHSPASPCASPPAAAPCAAWPATLTSAAHSPGTSWARSHPECGTALAASPPPSAAAAAAA